MTSVETAFEANAKRLRERDDAARALLRVNPLVEFLRVSRHSTMTLFEHLRRWWS